jgi:hypothetical protein
MLATPPEIATTNVREAAVIRLTVPRSEMRKVFGPGPVSAVISRGPCGSRTGKPKATVRRCG